MVHRPGQPEGKPVQRGLVQVHQLFHVRQVHDGWRHEAGKYSREYFPGSILPRAWKLHGIDQKERAFCWDSSFWGLALRSWVAPGLNPNPQRD
jgi:hypothetical protein